ncbi:hypothetical protein ABL78_2260 [Leptomonas seymouri]|uniref:Uncharacterized protein n=1 Tax=Leptomonas seymouri TaxID=5684 RepID=A0A0N0P7C8_LEPSE|nr:hypothetical protein ABL78_2260 [Leptomonas seymouri]|eukprot:KPI88656.1 hypothetical protein ABL78_2260 [Leptomonas seymouri]
MKRNGAAVPPAPRSFEELKPKRSGANTTSSSNSNAVSSEKTTMATIEPPPLWSHTASTVGAGTAAREEGGPQQSNLPPVSDEHKTDFTMLRRPNEGERYCHDIDHGGEELSASRSFGTYADASSNLAHLTAGKASAAVASVSTTSGGGGEGAAHEVRHKSSTHGIDLSKSPTTAALAAGARAAGAAQPLFLSLKLPSAPLTHAAATRSTQYPTTASLENATCDSPDGSTAAATAGERRKGSAGGCAWAASDGSPQRLDDLTGTTPRIPGAAAPAPGEGGHKGALLVDSKQSSTLFPRDVGPLPATRVRARNQLPSGTHIRRRPRSVANRRAAGSVNAPLADSLMDGADNVALMLNSANYGSPTTNAIDVPGVAVGGGGTAGRSAFASAPAIRPRGSGVATSGRGVGGGVRGTGRTREASSPGTRTGAAVPHRRRADPSPAPSRPPRARKGAAVICAASSTMTPVTPALATVPVPCIPTMSRSSPTRLDRARSRTHSYHQNATEHNVVGSVVSASATSLSQQHPPLSIPNSDASSPLNCSLDPRFLLANDKDASAVTVTVPASGIGNSAPLDGCGAASLNNSRGVLASSAAKSLSGRLLSGSVAHTHTLTPRVSTSLRGVDDNAQRRQDYLKLAEHYTQLCATLGELPNAEWVSWLHSTDSEIGQHPQQHSAGNNNVARTPSGEALMMEGLPCGDTSAATSSSLKEGRPAQASSSPVNNSLATAAAAATASARQQVPTPRARTPTASRAKSPRSGGTSASTNAAAKRSGSVGRITTVNRASILGSSQTHSSGATHTPRMRGATSGRSGAAATTATAASSACAPPAAPGPSLTSRETVVDLYAQQVLWYCAEHLQPYVDVMKSIQQQRQALDEALNSFVSITTSVIAPNSSTLSNAVGDAPRKSPTSLPLSLAHQTNISSTSTSHSHRGLHGSGKDAQAASSPVPSSLGTTPRKSSTPLPNTTSAAAAAIMSRRSASVASAKAASLTEGLQSVQGAVVALLNSLADGTRLAYLPPISSPSPAIEDALASSGSQGASKSTGALPPFSPTLVPLGIAAPRSPEAGASSSAYSVPPAEQQQTPAQPIPPPSLSPFVAPAGGDLPPLALHTSTAVSHLALSSSAGSLGNGEDGTKQPLKLAAQSNEKSQSALESGPIGGASISVAGHPPPIRFLDFVEAQEKEIAGQLSVVCGTVRTALGSPSSLVDTASTAPAEDLTKVAATVAEDPCGTSTLAAAAAVASAVAVTGSSVQLEYADMLNNPFFVPRKYLQNLALALSSTDDHPDEEAATEMNAPQMSPHGDASAAPARAKVPPATKSSKAPKKSKKTKSSGRLGSGTSMDTTGGGGITGRSSAGSTPRHRASLSAFAPLFTVRLSAEDAMPNDNASSEPQRRSVSSSSTENTITTAAAAATSGSYLSETFVLHCIQPTTALGLTPRQNIDSDVASGQQNSLQFTATDLGGSSASAASNTSVAPSLQNTIISGKTTGGRTSKRATSVGTSKLGDGTRQRSKSSGFASRASTTGATTAAAGDGRCSSDASRTVLTAPWLASQGGRGTSSSSPACKKPRKKLSIGSTGSNSSPAHAHTHPHGHHHTQPGTQLEMQRQLVMAWKLWGTLEHRFVSSCKTSGETRPSNPYAGVTSPDSSAMEVKGPESGGEMKSEAAQLLSPLGRVGEAAADSDKKTSTAASTEGVRRAEAMVVEVQAVESAMGKPKAGEETPDKQSACRLVPSPITTVVELPKVICGDDEDKEAVGRLYPTARVGGSMAVLSSDCSGPGPLVKDVMQGDLSIEQVSHQSSMTADLHMLSATLPQRTTLVSASALASDEVLAHSGAASERVTAEEQKAAQHILEWWASLRGRRESTARLRAAHAATNEQQRRHVMEARAQKFLLSCLCRRRLRRRIHARKGEQQHVGDEVCRACNAADASDSLDTCSSSSSSSKKPIKAVASPSLPVPAPSLAATSREKFLRSREQRKAIAAGAATAASSTSLADNGGRDACVARISPLPLASSGISTYAMDQYQSDSSFTVAAIHRLLHAPPSLLYTTCTAVLHYPTHPPMAYLDNTNWAKSNGVGVEREQSEAPPDPGARLGADAPSSTHDSRGCGRLGSRGKDASTEALWRKRGLCFVRFRDLRAYLCGEYEARIPPCTVPAAVACVPVNVTAASTHNTLFASRCGSSRQPAGAAMLILPSTMRYDSVVDANELHHRTPVTKTFHRPFEQWGMAYSLTSRIFCAAAIYAWQLIFSHTPFDDAKQRELPTREDRQARLERVAERNELILDCYGVRSEREWMREATKDLSFVGQIYMPNYPSDDPAQEKECMDSYDFVKDFLLQCFPNINKLSEIPDFLVGAGTYFLLKEVFHVSRDAPLARRLHKYVPHILVAQGADYLRAVTPASSPLYAGADGVGSDDDGQGTATSGSRAVAAPISLATPRATDYGKGGNGLSGLQRAALHRYEQLRQLYHLSYGMLDEEERAACAWGGMRLSDKSTQILPPVSSTHPSSQNPRSTSAGVKPASVTSKEVTKGSAVATSEDRCAGTSTGSTNAPDGVASDKSPMRLYMVRSGAGPMTPLRATPTTVALSSAFNTPAVMQDGVHHGRSSSGPSVSKKPAASTSPSLPKRNLPPRESDIQLAHLPHRLLRASAADAQFVREFEEEVTKSVRRIVDSVAGSGSSPSLNSTELPAMLMAEVDVHDALDIAYPHHFLVKLSEMLAFELFGLQVSLGSCEDLDSVSP